MGHHYQSLAGIGTVIGGDGADPLIVEAMHRFIKHQQGRILHESPRDQAQALLTTGKGKENPHGTKQSADKTR